MTRATATALTFIRVARGAERPSDSELRAALDADRKRLRITPHPAISDYAVSGPYAVVVDGEELDEYVVWER